MPCAVDGQRRRRRSGSASSAPTDRRGGGQRDVVLAAGAAADHRDPDPLVAPHRPHPRADAGDDLVLDGVGPRRPLGDGRLARAHPGPKTTAVSPSAGGSSPTSTTTWSMEIRPTTGAPPAARAAPRRGRWSRAAARRRTRAGAGPGGYAGSPTRCGRSRPGCRPARCARRPPGRSGSSRAAASVVSGRVDADQPGADPAQGVVAERVGQGGGGRGQVAQRRPQPGLAGPRDAPARSGRGRWRCRGRRARRRSRGGPSPRSRARVPARSARRAIRQRPAQSSGAAPSRAMPVSSWRWIRAPMPERGTASRWSRPGTARSMPARDRRAEVGVQRVQPAQRRHAEPRPGAGRAPRRCWSRRARRRRWQRAVRATSAAPCPKPSALTTAISAPDVRSAKSRVLAATRPGRRCSRGPGSNPAGCELGLQDAHAASATRDRAVERGGAPVSSAQ